jgi:hypothetical protein
MCSTTAALYTLATDSCGPQRQHSQARFAHLVSRRVRLDSGWGTQLVQRPGDVDNVNSDGTGRLRREDQCVLIAREKTLRERIAEL